MIVASLIGTVLETENQEMPFKNVFAVRDRHKVADCSGGHNLFVLLLKTINSAYIHFYYLYVKIIG